MGSSAIQPLRALASLRLTVTLFALSMFLIFAGTLAQVHSGIWEVINGYFRTPIAWIDAQLFVPQQVGMVDGAFPFPGGYTLAALLMVNLIAAHITHFTPSWKRSGIILLHAGIIVLLAGEFVTGLFADEGLMTIREGESSNYVEDSRRTELVVLESLDNGNDRVVAIPESKLRPGRRIEHEALPFDVEVIEWYTNSSLRRASPHDDHPATDGKGLDWIPRREARTSGLDGMVPNVPSAYVRLYDDEEELGIWMVWADQIDIQDVVVDGQTYSFELRFERRYKPYSLHLHEFRFDRFVGTNRPRNYSSRLQLVDPMRDEDREVLIRMNQPLRHAGATFYQSSFTEDEKGTVLQVVRNPGWLMPYIACGMVAMGMIVHFGMHLGRFVRRRLS